MFNDYFINVEKRREKKNIELMEHRIYEIDKIIKNDLTKGIIRKYRNRRFNKTKFGKFSILYNIKG